MTNPLRSRGIATSASLFVIATFAIAIFIGDTATQLEIAVGVLYVPVVLMSARFYRARGVILAAAACTGLTVLSFFLTPHEWQSAGVTNTLLGIGAVGLTTFLVVQRQSVEVALSEQANLLSLTHDGILVFHLDGTIRYWNRGAQELYGWAAEEAEGKVSHDLLKTVFPAPLEDLKTELLRAGRWEGELVHTKKDGTKVVVASRWSLEKNESGKPGAVLEINNDITERKRAEEELLKVHAELEQKVIERTRDLEAANRELEAFAYSVSHDLRAPLRHMAGYAELLQKNASSSLDEKNRRYTTMVVEAAKRMGTLIDDLLAFSRVGRAEIQKTLVSLEQVAKEALNDVRQDALARDILWKMGALPNVHGDRSMLRVALTNLIANAIKFTRTRAQAVIEVGCVDGNREETVVFIKDNGVGFDRKYVDKLFGVFQRLHRTEDFEGTGIGLATVQRIIHRHGGRVWAEGVVNQGATFYFSLPKSQEGKS